LYVEIKIVVNHMELMPHFIHISKINMMDNNQKEQNGLVIKVKKENQKINNNKRFKLSFVRNVNQKNAIVSLVLI
jgi:hypothetical protein